MTSAELEQAIVDLVRHASGPGPLASIRRRVWVDSQAVKGFASVKLVRPENGAFTLLVQPYALAGEALDRWRALVAANLAVAA
jgi:hypothetical protein